jgi:hypothetical protein
MVVEKVSVKYDRSIHSGHVGMPTKADAVAKTDPLLCAQRYDVKDRCTPTMLAAL